MTGPPCTAWSILQYNNNFVNRRHLWQRRVLWQARLAVKLCWEQLAQGQHFIFENPAQSRLWLEPAVVALRNDPRVYTVVGHACAHGARQSRKSTVFPPMWCSTMPRWPSSPACVRKPKPGSA